MIFKLKFEEPFYFINNKIIICKRSALLYKDNVLISKFTCKGKSICNNNDTFNEKVGTKIATIKCDRKLHLSCQKYMTKFYKTLAAKLLEYNIFISKCKDCVASNDAYLDKILNEC